MTEHLSDEQFYDLLSGELSEAAAQAHLASCDRCRREAVSVQSATENFNRLSMAWANAEAPRRVRTPSRLGLILGGRPAWGAGLAGTAVACLIAVGFNSPLAHVPRATPTSAQIALPSTAEIAEDDRLMQSINQELRYDAQPGFPVSDLQHPGHRAQPRSANRMSR